ncbi:hypothetical protein ACFYOV_18940 [Streptomyces sp. NPDC005931]|uniref:hypothetical protein n=1 Tax=Streptomyces sp. NPDC005931 TaxID=3364737 RepID=UPI003689DA2E
MTVGRVAAIGERSRVAGLALAGVLVLAAEDATAVRRSWRALPDGVDLVVLTPAAAEALGVRTEPSGPRGPLITVMPS